MATPSTLLGDAPLSCIEADVSKSGRQKKPRYAAPAPHRKKKSIKWYLALSNEIELLAMGQQCVEGKALAPHLYVRGYVGSGSTQKRGISNK